MTYQRETLSAIMPMWGMMTELGGVLMTWALINVLFVSLFLFGGWRRDRFVRASPALQK